MKSDLNGGSERVCIDISFLFKPQCHYMTYCLVLIVVIEIALQY